MRKIQNLLLILAAGILLAGCGKNPYDQGMEALESGAYEEAAAQFQQAVEEEFHLPLLFRDLREEAATGAARLAAEKLDFPVR